MRNITTIKLTMPSHNNKCYASNAISDMQSCLPLNKRQECASPINYMVNRVSHYYRNALGIVNKIVLT